MYIFLKIFSYIVANFIKVYPIEYGSFGSTLFGKKVLAANSEPVGRVILML